MKQSVFNKIIRCLFDRDAVPVPMRTWYIYRTRRSFTPVADHVSFRFRKDRKSFDTQDMDLVNAKDYTFYYHDTVPLIFKQIMIEAELTRKYKA